MSCTLNINQYDDAIIENIKLTINNCLDINFVNDQKDNLLLHILKNFRYTNKNISSLIILTIKKGININYLNGFSNASDYLIMSYRKNINDEEYVSSVLDIISL